MSWRKRELLGACGSEGKPDAEKVKALLKKEGIENGLNQGGIELDVGFLLTPLEVACKGGYLEIVEILMRDPRIKVNSSSLIGALPFYTACAFGQLEIVKYMLMNERIITDFTKSKNNPLVDACVLKQIDVGKWILASGRKIPKKIIESAKSSLEKLKDINEKILKFIQLLRQFLLDPIQARKKLRKELGLPG